MAIEKYGLAHEFQFIFLMKNEALECNDLKHRDSSPRISLFRATFHNHNLVRRVEFQNSYLNH